MLSSIVLATVMSATSVGSTPINLEKKSVSTINHETQIRCLAKNIYFEAGNQSHQGKVAVAQVVLNRAKNPKFPNTACSVINQKSRGVCQFSWVCKNPSVRDRNLYNRSLDIARDVYHNRIKDNTFGALFFHANYVRPSWSRTFRHTITIGDHKFYR